MCGLVGAVGNLYSMDRKAVKWLLTLDVLRGEDSTGLAYVPKGAVGDNKAKIVKELGHPYNLFYNHPEVFDEKSKELKIDAKVFIGHNRSATVGEIHADNAHPFKFDHITGAHNGTLYSYWLDQLDDFKDFDVDSQVIFHNIAKHGYKETIPNLFGAYALTWWDEKEKAVYFVRNDDRPLWCVRTRDKDGFYWASEPWMLVTALKKAGIQHGEPQYFEKDWVYRIKVEEEGIKFREVMLEKLEKIEGGSYSKNYQSSYPLYSGDTYGGHGHGGSNVFKSNSNVVHLNTSNTNKKTSVSLRQQKKELEALVGTDVNFFVDRLIKGSNKMEFVEGSPVSLEDKFDIRLYSHNKHLINKWLNAAGSSRSFKGKIKRVVLNRSKVGMELYVLLDYRTIEENIDTDKKKVDLVGFQGRFLTEDEWLNATCDGCSYCSASVEFHQADKLRWLDHTSFLCPECREEPEVIKYVNSFVSIH